MYRRDPDAKPPWADRVDEVSYEEAVVLDKLGVPVEFDYGGPQTNWLDFVPGEEMYNMMCLRAHHADYQLFFFVRKAA